MGEMYEVPKAIIGKLGDQSGHAQSQPTGEVDPATKVAYEAVAANKSAPKPPVDLELDIPEPVDVELE